MDAVVTVCAWSMSALMVAQALHNVSAIGRDQGPYTTAHYIGQILRGGVTIIIAGRVLGWW